MKLVTKNLVPTRNTHLTWYCMWFTNLVTPITSSYWNNRQLGQNNGTSDCSGHFFWALDTKTHMSVVITNSNKCFETSSLSSPGLFLDRHDLQNLVLQCRTKEEINNFKLLEKLKLFLRKENIYKVKNQRGKYVIQVYKNYNFSRIQSMTYSIKHNLSKFKYSLP